MTPDAAASLTGPMLAALGLAGASLSVLVALLSVLGCLVSGFTLYVANGLMEVPKRGLGLSLVTMLLSTVLVLVSAMLLRWIPVVGPGLAALVAWFLTVATVEEMHDTTLSRAAVCVAVSGFLGVLLVLAALRVIAPVMVFLVSTLQS